jgi:hypothetical protein
MASIRCAHCKQTHASVKDVFNCAQHEQQNQYRWEVEQDERNAAFWSGAGL